MSKWIADTSADEGKAGAERDERCVRGRGAAAMVRHLEHVHPGVASAPETGSEQLRVDLLLDVAGEEHPAMGQSKVEHDRDVVDSAAVVQGMQRHLRGR
jgi:hypothetical protein